MSRCLKLPAIGSRQRWITRLLVLLVVLVAAATVVFGTRAYRTAILLSSAFEAGVPQASSVRPWMTLGYVASAYGAPEAALRGQLGLPPQTPSDTTLKTLAERAGVPRADYVQRVQRAIASVAAIPVEARAAEATGWLEEAGQEVVAGVLVYGYAALAVTLLLGALGVPLPSGLSMVVAGSLAAQGQLSWMLLAPIATAASVGGDLIGYAIGRSLGGPFLERRGRWLGLTPGRRARVERLFERWGALAVLLSRSLVSVLSSAVNLVAGAGRYPLGAFAAFGIIGRLAWTLAYLGLGYVTSGGIEPAAGFLGSLTALLVSLALLAGLAAALRSRMTLVH